ncbi:hypothetical protein NJF54_01800 [Pseudomonas guariconensis]|uniref:phage baseplate protein n=1 Tax=Pseudomonas guariconensis TaxID=1288410 RepID=UPI00209B608A|nr:hypothetical protein [Pseudomonas guariconensis]MCO7630557.1 hypothetical protein [Pseudomonas guariconensis]
MRKKILSIVKGGRTISLVALFFWVGSVSAAVCEPSVDELPKKLKEGYFRLANPIAEKIIHLGSFHIEGQYSGTLIQSIAFDKIRCKWVAAISTARKPELVAMMTFPAVAPYVSRNFSVPSSRFSHPQDLSFSISGNKSEFWLPDNKRKGVNRFELDEEGSVVNLKNFSFSRRPINGLFTAVSADGKYIVVMGAEGQKKKRQRVSVYKVRDLVRLEAGELKPMYSWLLDDIQQDRKQWRQGLAVIGSTVFVLSGSHSRSQDKLIVSYKLEGGTLAINKLPDASSGMLMKGKITTYEPEGLEAIRYDGRPALAFGMAGGTKGARSYDVWVLPLDKN